MENGSICLNEYSIYYAYNVYKSRNRFQIVKTKTIKFQLIKFLYQLY